MAEDDEDRGEPILPVLKLPATAAVNVMDSPEHPSTPSLRTLASVPFKWEQQPGIPRPCTPRPHPPKSLLLPPCPSVPFIDRLITKTLPSPTTVFDGPYNVARPKFSSFRFFRDGPDSFDNRSCHSNTSPESAAEVGNKKVIRRIFVKFKGRRKGAGDGGRFLFSSSSTNTITNRDADGRRVRVNDVDQGKMRRHGSFSRFSNANPITNTTTHFWDAMYEGLKHVIPWKNIKKSKKEVQA